MVNLEEIAQGGAFDTVEAVRELARVVVELTARVAALEAARVETAPAPSPPGRRRLGAAS